MSIRLRRSIALPIREGMTLEELWHGPDNGLIWCWERGRQKSIENPELAAAAVRGELVVLAWKGGVDEKTKIEKKPGTLKYLATWQGLRGEDLDIAVDKEHAVVCSKTGQAVLFSSRLPVEEE